MKLTATVACNTADNDLSFVSFYDQEKQYGLSLSRNPSDSTVEVMVGDQSSYALSGFGVHLSRDRVLVTLPFGSVDPIDGDNQYDVAFELNDQEFSELRQTLSHVLHDLADLQMDL